ncbi:MAG: hypothetical protein HZB24_16605 [Desulfobacterales bacterium]|nr:hypothetical protein [Desulfobacterales bacterium]
MGTNVTVPDEFQESFRRLLPHMVAGLRNDPQGLEAIYLYLKLGGEKLARIAIDAYNQTHRLKNAQMQKLRLEEALMAEQMEESEEDEDEDEALVKKEESEDGDEVEGF